MFTVWLKLSPYFENKYNVILSAVFTPDMLIIIEEDLLMRLPPVSSIPSACFARVFLWFQAVLSIYVSPLWISKSSSMIINISGLFMMCLFSHVSVLIRFHILLINSMWSGVEHIPIRCIGNLTEPYQGLHASWIALQR